MRSKWWVIGWICLAWGCTPDGDDAPEDVDSAVMLQDADRPVAGDAGVDAEIPLADFSLRPADAAGVATTLSSWAQLGWWFLRTPRAASSRAASKGSRG